MTLGGALVRKSVSNGGSKQFIQGQCLQLMPTSAEDDDWRTIVMSNPVNVSRQGAVLDIKLSRPARKNALSNEMYRQLTDLFDEANRDDAVRCLTISGDGAAFTAGNDLQEFLSDPPVTDDAPVFQMLRALAANEKVLIAAVNGLAVGIGTTMLLHCDLVLAVPEARFQLPFINLAIVPEAASSLLLPRLIGYQRAMELLLLGEPFDAQVARSYGLVNRIVPSAELVSTLQSLVEQIMQKPPNALRALKRLVLEDRDVVLARMNKENAMLGAQISSAEGRAAVSALLEKRGSKSG